MGPLAKVDTIVAGINMDVQRELYMGRNRTMRFMVPDTTQASNWRTLLVLLKGFQRVTGQEKTTGDGSEVTFIVADPDEVLISVITLKDLHVEVEEIIYSVAKVPQIASSEAQIFTFTCKIRTIRNKFFDNKK